MQEIYQDLYQFSDYIPPVDLSLHQYLLLAEEPVLVHTGVRKQAEAMLPQLKQLLDGRALKYILVSHFESDECGGLPILLQEYPQASVICSGITARELAGFGIACSAEAKNGGGRLSGKGFVFEFIDYPSEIHLQNGLLFFETGRRIFFSSDLMFRFGNTHGRTIESSWQAETGSVTPERVPCDETREKLIRDLTALHPAFIAAGHGPCVYL